MFGTRPVTLREIARRINTTDREEMDVYSAMAYHVSDFCHAYRINPSTDFVRAAIAGEPEDVSEIVDVFLGGFAELLANRHNVVTPAWAEGEFRRLPSPVHMCSRSAWEAGLVNTPPELARRNLITDEIIL